jgi:hypothetical protein
MILPNPKGRNEIKIKQSVFSLTEPSYVRAYLRGYTCVCLCVYISIYIYTYFFFAVALRPNAGHGLFILEVSRSNTTKHHSR